MRYKTDEEIESAARYLKSLREEWVGVELDFGGWSKEVQDVTMDDAGRVFLCVRGGELGEHPYTTQLEPLSKWTLADA